MRSLWLLPLLGSVAVFFAPALTAQDAVPPAHHEHPPAQPSTTLTVRTAENRSF